MRNATMRVRHAEARQAGVIAQMANAFNEYEGTPARPFTPELILRDGLGPGPAFSALAAEGLTCLRPRGSE
jgi:hypothetical protein